MKQNAFRYESPDFFLLFSLLLFVLTNRLLDCVRGGGDELVARADDTIIRRLDGRELSFEMRHDVDRGIPGGLSPTPPVELTVSPSCGRRGQPARVSSTPARAAPPSVGSMPTFPRKRATQAPAVMRDAFQSSVDSAGTRKDAGPARRVASSSNKV